MKKFKFPVLVLPVKVVIVIRMIFQNADLSLTHPFFKERSPSIFPQSPKGDQVCNVQMAEATFPSFFPIYKGRYETDINGVYEAFHVKTWEGMYNSPFSSYFLKPEINMF